MSEPSAKRARTHFPFLPEEKMKLLRDCANQICAPGKGILAADESTGTIGQRFDNIGLKNEESNRAAYRALLATADTQGLGAVIFFEETLKQKTESGQSIVAAFQERNIIPGIKLDKGVKPLGGTNGETTTQGLDNLDVRCKEFFEQGMRFAKWRNTLFIREGCPSELALRENANDLARYASICQQNGLVPIVEPELMCDGDHDLATALAVQERVLSAQYKALNEHNVYLEGSLLKCSMVTAGMQCATKYTPEQVGEATVLALSRTVPPAVPGVMFLSGGHSEVDATIYLNAINKYKLANASKAPWALSFSYGRALQASVLAAWKGKKENVKAAQDALAKRALLNGLAAMGKYEKEDVDPAAAASLFVKNHTY